MSNPGDPATSEASPTQSGRRRPLEASDLLNALTLAVCAAIAWLLPARAWRPAARTLASLHGLLRRGSDARFGSAADALGVERTDLKRNVLTENYLDHIEVMREHHPRGYTPRIEVGGADKLAPAARGGRGAVLWVAAMVHSDLIAKKALRSAGIEVTHLSTEVHGYSGSEWGKRHLNRLRVDVENRYLTERVLVDYAKPLAAMRTLQARLKGGSIVSIKALGSGLKRVGVPFAAGTLHLAVGAPRLAVSTGCPIYPVFTERDESGGFTVRIGDDLRDPDERDPEAAIRKICEAFAARLGDAIGRHPEALQAWTNRESWTPRDESPRVPDGSGQQ